MNTNGKARLLIVDAELQSITELRQLIQADAHVEVVGHAVASLDAIQKASAVKPDVVCIDLNILGAEGIAIGEAIAARLPATRMIMILPEGRLDADVGLRAMRAGVSELLVRPFTASDFSRSVGRAKLLTPHGEEALEEARTAARELPAPARAVTAPPPAPAPPEPSGQGEVLTVFSAMGGIGRSTVAVNLAIALREVTKSKVVLVDGNLHFGDVGILLNMRSTRSMVDICTPKGGADTELLDAVLLSHYSGVRVLLGPPSPEFAEIVTPGALGIIVKALRASFDYVVVDTHNSLDEATLMLLDLSDHVLLLTSSGLPAMKNTKLFLQVAEMLNYKEGKLMLVINRHDARGRISLKDIETSLHQPVFAAIDRDDNAAAQAEQTGQPFVIHQKSAAISQGLYRIAGQLNTAHAAEAAAPRRRGLFGRLGGAS